MSTIAHKIFSKINHKNINEFIFLALLLNFLLYLSFQNFLLFHTISKVITITIAINITFLSIYSNDFNRNNSLSFLGMAYLFVAIFHFLHTITYKGMGIFPEFDANVPTQLWIMARYFESISLLIMTTCINRKLNIRILTVIYTIISIFLLLSLFYWGIFPDSFVEGVGLTTFKIFSEYIICGLLAIAIHSLIKKRKTLHSKTFNYMVYSLLFNIVSELFFVFYVDVYGLSIMIGHIFKLISFYMVYKAIIESTLRIPYKQLHDTNQILNKKQRELINTNEELTSENEIRTNIEKELQNKNEILSAVLETSNEGILVIDNEKNIIMANTNFKRMWDINENLIGKKYDEFLLQQLNQKVVDSNEYISMIESIDSHYSPNSQYIYLLNGTILTSQQRNFINDSTEGQVISYRDITERIKSQSFKKRLEREQKLLNEVREYDRLKTEFFSNLSHELKTPLNIILGAVKLLKSIHHDSNEIHCKHYRSTEKYTSMIKQNSNRLLRLIDNLIDITRIDTGFFNVYLKNQDIVCIVESITLSVSDYIKEKGIDLIFDTDVEEKLLACDADKLERIMLNLLSNAIKFTDVNGLITVNIYDNKEYITIAVKDNGVGIPVEMHSKIFERFRQVDPLLSRRAEGSGIGLSLVKALVEAHEGKIWVESSVGMGSTFFIEIPVKLLDDVDTISHISIPTNNNNIERISIEFSDIYKK